MARALIGHTGFVGGTLLRQVPFDALYNSRNVEDLGGWEFELLVCAGAPGQKWLANKYPTTDRAAIDRLIRALARVRADFVILLSTVDVFPSPIEVDEDTPIRAADQQPYGRHRLVLEHFVADHFPALIVRLPGLFGPGLRKNIVYDFLHDNQVGAVHARSVYQFYDMAGVWSDLQSAYLAGLRLVHFATEPVSVAEVAREAFGRVFRQEPAGVQPARYDFRTRHAAVFGGTGGYLYDRAEVLDLLRHFVRAERAHFAARPAA
jgi:nucleoside-diphosphate-sugar epimerase